MAAAQPQGADRARAVGACRGRHPQRVVGEEHPGEARYARHDPPRPTTPHHAPPRPTTPHHAHHTPPHSTTIHHDPPGWQLAPVGGAEAAERRAPRSIDRAGYCGGVTDSAAGRGGWRPSGSNWSTVPQELWWALPRRTSSVSFATRCYFYLLLLLAACSLLPADHSLHILLPTPTHSLEHPRCEWFALLRPRPWMRQRLLPYLGRLEALASSRW